MVGLCLVLVSVSLAGMSISTIGSAAEPRQSSAAVTAFSDELASNPKTSNNYLDATNTQCSTGIGCVQCPQAAKPESTEWLGG